MQTTHIETTIVALCLGLWYQPFLGAEELVLDLLGARRGEFSISLMGDGGMVVKPSAGFGTAIRYQWSYKYDMGK